MYVCARCHQYLSGRYIVALGRAWHNNCFRCAGCSQLIVDQSFYPRDEQAYHEYCYHELFSPRCSVCGKPVQDKFVRNAWGEIYCDAHNRGTPTCYSCGRLISQQQAGGGVKYLDGRVVCNACRTKVIETLHAAQRPLTAVRKVLTRLGLSLGDASTPIRLVFRFELVQISKGERTADPSGLARCRSIRTGSQEERRIEEILILTGLPEEHFSAILAHELCHAWIFLNRFPGLPDIVEEGLAELVSYLWLREQATSQASFRCRLMEQNPDPIYGKGFQRAWVAYKLVGLSRLLDHCQRYQQYPG